MFGFSLPLFAITFLVIAAVGFFVTRSRKNNAAKDALARVLDGPWIDARNLVADRVAEIGKYGADEGPGCYIILVFDHEVLDGDYSGYREAHVGKALEVYEGACLKVAELMAEGTTLNDADEQSHTYVQVRHYPEEKLKVREMDIAKLLGVKLP